MLHRIQPPHTTAPSPPPPAPPRAAPRPRPGLARPCPRSPALAVIIR